MANLGVTVSQNCSLKRCPFNGAKQQRAYDASFGGYSQGLLDLWVGRWVVVSKTFSEQPKGTLGERNEAHFEFEWRRTNERRFGISEGLIGTLRTEGSCTGNGEL